jgi:hypothetical protein
MTATDTTSTAVQTPAQSARLPGFMRELRRLWRHPVTRYYRRHILPALPNRLAAIGIGLIWGTFLIGGTLAVAAYPQATDVSCDWWGCAYPLGGINNPLYGFNQLLDDAIILMLVLGLIGLVLAVMGRSFIRGMRGDWQPDVGGSRSLATSWQNGVMDLLTLTPVIDRELLHIRLLCRLYAMWQRRAWFVMVYGALVTLVVANHIVYPIFWWLGPWRHWAAQLLLVLVWGVNIGVWAAAFGLFGLLSEVAYVPSGSRSVFNWSGVPMLVITLMVIMPLLVLLWSNVFFWTLAQSSYHDGNTLRTVTAPLWFGALGGAFCALNYGLSVLVYRMRLRARTG